MKIIIFIPWFYPAYKAGGPIQSIINLVIALQDKYTFYIITSAYDLQSSSALDNITPNSWNNINLPGCESPVSVWYTSHENNFKQFKKLIKAVSPDTIYLNDIFSFNFFLLPILILKFIKNNIKLVVCPRGMLQEGALANKKLKKKIYLSGIKHLRLLNKVKWHATTVEEKKDIIKHFKYASEVVVANNIPKQPLHELTPLSKSPDNLRLVYLSLITEKKNLFLLLNLLKKIDNVTLDIYGPIKDKTYWKACVKLLDVLPGKVTYKGDVLPKDVQSVLSQYHAMVLLTKGENFGHALFESLGVGRPIITSFFTPWNNLKEQKAGWNVDINNKAECISVLNEIQQLSDKEYSQFCLGAYTLSISYYNSLKINDNYYQLFDR